MKQAEVQRQLYDGFGEAMTRALEFVIIPFLFGALGYFLDGRLSTRPVLMLILGAIGVVGCAIKTFYGYRYKMAQAEKDMPWNR